MSTTLDRIPQEISAPALDPAVREKPRIAYKSAGRMLRAIVDSWRFAKTCMRLSKSADEGLFPAADATGLLERASAENPER